jgi:hypothetical protein
MRVYQDSYLPFLDIHLDCSLLQFGRGQFSLCSLLRLTNSAGSGVAWG